MTIATATVELFTKIVDTIKATAKEGVEPVVEYDKAYERAVPQLGGKYKLRITPVSMGKGYWSTNVVEILDTATGATLGYYTRNYSSFYSTFYPFRQNGREYALYSRDYTATRVMSLPDCADVAGEAPNSFGFCPTGFYVPQPEDARIKEAHEEADAQKSFDGTFGFVCGCVWGDDSGGWKLQYLDLSKLAEGVIKREARMGYIEIDDEDALADAIDLHWYDPSNTGRKVSIKTRIEFDLARTSHQNFSHLTYSEYEAQRDAEKPQRVEKCAGCGHLGKNHARADGSCWMAGCGCKAFQGSGQQATPEEVADE